MKRILFLISIFISIISYSQVEKETVQFYLPDYENLNCKSQIEIYTELIKLHPDSSMLYANRGGAKYWLEQYKEGLDDCNRALVIDELNPVAYHNRGLIFLNTNKFERAIKDFTNAIAIYPNFARAYSFRGNAYGSIGNYKQALKDLDQAIKIAPDGISYYNRGVLNGYLENYDEELSDYSNAIKLDNSIEGAYMNRGIIRGRDLRDYDGAISDFSNAIRLNPVKIEALMNRGFAYSLIGDYKSAKQDYEKVLSIDNNNRKAIKELEMIKDFY